MAQSRAEISTAVRDYIHAILDYGRESADDYAEDDLLDTLGLDSISRVDLVMALEEEFSREISDDEAERLRTVGDVINLIAA